MSHVALQKFIGPVFIIGMPRSGTKLLRELLNGHSQISIPSGETSFLPYWIHHWQEYGDLSRPENFKQFYETVIKFRYFVYMKEQDALISQATWFQTCRNFSVAGVFEALVRHDSDAAWETNIIWGDKSPAYIDHITLLKSVFPQARFLHVIRDVRDYCLSVQKAWGKNPVRAAQRWADSVAQARQAGRQCGRDYLEIAYEELLNQPETTIRNCCQWLELKFEPEMMHQLRSGNETIGDAKGYRSIKRDNSKKYLKQMSPILLNRVEQITCETLHQCGYETEYLGKVKRVSTGKMMFYKILDAISLVRSEMKQRGLWDAIKLQWSSFYVSN